MIRYLKAWRAWWLYRRALSAYDDARYFQTLAALRAGEGLDLERAATITRLEATS